MKRRRRVVRVGPWGIVEIPYRSEAFQRVTIDQRPAQKCVKCCQRPRELPYTQCHSCRIPILQAASRKAWRVRKKMHRARELAREGRA
jgi:hypothetical protein